MNEKNRRARSLRLMELLSCLTRGSVITPKAAADCVRDFTAGSDDAVKSIIYNPALPIEYLPVADMIRQEFVNQ